jgi:type IV pilus modification protein PilV
MMNTQKKKGFSLIEVMVAVLILGVGMLGLAKIQGITFLNSAASRMQTHAVNLAQEKIEEFRNYAKISTYTAMATDSTGTDIVGANVIFTRTWAVTTCPNSVLCKNVSVLVEWDGVDGIANKVNLTSQISEAEPAKSGMIIGTVNWIGDSPEQSAAKAAASAAAAAQYESIVAASSDATDPQKAAAAAARDRAEQAAVDAQNAAESGDATEAEAQAAIAAAAVQDILAILNSLPGFAYGFSGTANLLLTNVTVPSGLCSFYAKNYACSGSDFADELSVTGIAGTSSTACVVDLTISPVEGCTLIFVSDCTAAWGDSVTEGSYVTAYQSESGTTCPSEEQLCTAGLLNGSYSFAHCEILCVVPNYVGTKINSVAQPWNTTGPGTVDRTAISGNKSIATQTLTASSEVACTSTMVVDD